jgi:hypothetical protein
MGGGGGGVGVDTWFRWVLVTKDFEDVFVFKVLSLEIRSDKDFGLRLVYREGLGLAFFCKNSTACCGLSLV